MIWTAAMDAAIETMWRDGKTLLAIAEAMNKAGGTSLSRSAIQGRLRRLAKWTHKVAPRELVSAIRAKPLGTPAELLELDADGCRWGVEADASNLHRHIFCNKHRHDKQPYCWEHYCKSVGFRP